MPAEAGIHKAIVWIPAFAGMTLKGEYVDSRDIMDRRVFDGGRMGGGERLSYEKYPEGRPSSKRREKTYAHASGKISDPVSWRVFYIKISFFSYIKHSFGAAGGFFGNGHY